MQHRLILTGTPVWPAIMAVSYTHLEAENLKVARPRLERIETDILNNFKVLGAQAQSLNGLERLEIQMCIRDRINKTEKNHTDKSKGNTPAFEEKFGLYGSCLLYTSS